MVKWLVRQPFSHLTIQPFNHFNLINMAINLSKGQTINLNKDENDLSRITIGLGWDLKKKKQGLLGGLFGGGGGGNDDFDLDAIAFLLDQNGKVANLGRTVNMQGRQVGLVDSDVIFFNNLRHPDGFITHTGDNRTGAGDGDDEQITVTLGQVPQRYQRIQFMVCIFQGATRNQHFGLVENAYIRSVDNKNKEIARYNLSNSPDYNNLRTVVLGEVYRHNDGWKFRALGEGHATDNFVEILKQHVYTTNGK